MAWTAVKAVMDECRRTSWLDQLARRPRGRPHVLPQAPRENDGGLSKSSPQRTGLPEQRGEVQHEPMIKPVKYYEE